MGHQELFKLKNTPNGKALHAYMAAILEVTGMNQGKAFPLGKYFGNMRTHLENGRLVRIEDGYQLTPKGRDYFEDRYSVGNPQHIDSAMVEAMMSGIRTGGPDWEKLS